MLRVYKTYTFPFRAQSTNAESISFSSYPGVLSSSDDYYTTLPSLLTVMETTNSVMNQSLFVNYISPKTVPFWVRVMTATRMARGGKDWAAYFAAYNRYTFSLFASICSSVTVLINFLVVLTITNIKLLITNFLFLINRNYKTTYYGLLNKFQDMS